MSRSAVVGNIIAMLEDAGFLVSARCAIRPKSFDIAARRGEDILLVKILGNIDAYKRTTGMEMRRLGEYLAATPIVIGLQTRDEPLKPGVVYFRHGVPVLNPDTAMELFIHGTPPLIYAAPGGLYVNIDGDLLEEVRRERGWSLGQLAKELGVSRRTISKYEDGMNASIEVAIQLEEVFQQPFTHPVSVLDETEEFQDSPAPDQVPPVEAVDEPIVSILTEAGFIVHPTVRAPFKTVSHDDDQEGSVALLTGHSAMTKTARKRARIMASLGEVTRTRSVYFTETDAKATSVEGTAIVSHRELATFREPEEVREVIRERTEDPLEV